MLVEKKICFDMDGLVCGGVLFDDEEHNRNMWGQGAYEPCEILNFLRGLKQYGIFNNVWVRLWACYDSRQNVNAVFQNFPNMENFGIGTCHEKFFKKHLTNRTIYDIIYIVKER